MCANYPCASGMYVASCTALAEPRCKHLAGLDPDKRHALNAAGPVAASSPARAPTRALIQYELIGSAYGSSVGLDGASGISALLTNAHTAPVEILESRFPTRLNCFELIPDAGGVGEFRGGLSPRRWYTILADGVRWTLRGGRNRVPATPASTEADRAG